MAAQKPARKTRPGTRRTPGTRPVPDRVHDPLRETIRKTVTDIETQRLADALHRSEVRYRSLVHATAQVVWTASAEGDVTEDLPTWREFTGQTYEEILGRGWMAAVHPDDVPHVARVWEESLLAKAQHTNEFRVLRADGVYRLMHAKAVPIIGSGGEVEEWIGTCTDITEQRENEERHNFLMCAGDLLSASLEYEVTLKGVANLAVPKLADWCTVYILEEDGSIQQLAVAHADPAMLDFVREFQQKYPPDHKRTLEQIQSGKPLLLSTIPDELLVQNARDEEHLRIARSLKLGSYMGVPLIARGRALGLIGFFTNIGRHYTEKDLSFAQELASRAALAVDNARLFRETNAINKNLERKVAARTRELEEARMQDRANYRRLRFIIANLPIAAIAVDEHDMIIEMNPLFTEMLGVQIDPAKMLGKYRPDVVREWKSHVVNREAHVRMLDEMVRNRLPVLNLEVPMMDGRILVRDFIPIKEEGTYYGYIVIYRDVTQERRIDATKSEFMSLASHQLRTPLTAIRWIFGRLAKNLTGRVGPLEEHLIEDGRAATARMAETINTMLQISRIQAGQVEIERRSVPVREFLHEILDSYAEEAAAKSQTIRVKCPDDLRFSTDPRLLKELMANLCSNAIKYTPENGSICLFALHQGNTIHIAIHDTGYGIPQHQQAKVFHKFFRGDNVVSKDPDGTGLGLHMVSLITDLLGGTITFESEPGRGTTFRLALPATSGSGSHRQDDFAGGRRTHDSRDDRARSAG